MKLEKLDGHATVKGTMLKAHLDWAKERLPDMTLLLPHLDGTTTPLVRGFVLSTQWIPFKSLIAIDRAIATVMGGPPEDTWLELGRFSAHQNLDGVYKTFISNEPHRFFEKSALLHERFQNFGECRYEKTGERSGRMTLVNYPVFSEVFDLSGKGYYEEALRLMHVPGPISVTIVASPSNGDEHTVFDFRW
ncbi:MAG: hypothetical protein JNK60_07555 [Acidobacteria bacterium]|nr:hypothetical protein [Acidobacteriota bacterium]